MQPMQGMSPMQSMQDDEDSINLLDLLDVVLDQRWLIAAVTTLVLALGVSYAFLATPIYEANTLIQVEDSKGSGAAGFLGDAASLFDIKSPATAELELLRSRLVVGRAVENLKLDLIVTPKYIPVVGRWLSRQATELSNPGFLGLSGYVSGTEELKVEHFHVPQTLEGLRFTVVSTDSGFDLLSPDNTVLGKGVINQVLAFTFKNQNGDMLVASLTGKPSSQFYLTKLSRLGVTERLQKQLVIAEKGKQSGIITSTLQGADPLLTATILNEINNFYVRQNVERKAAEAEKSIKFLNTQLPELRKQLEGAEVKFNKFRNQSGTFNLSAEAQGMLDQSVGLKVKLLEAQQKRQDLQARFTAQHPTVQVLDAQIKNLTQQINAMEGKAKSFPNVEQDLLRLTRDVKVNNELYTSLLNSFQQLRLVKEGKVGNVRVVDVAAVPEQPVKPQKAMVLALSGVLGVLVGLGLAFLRNSLRPGIKNADDIEQHVGLHVFATVPHSGDQTQLTVESKDKSTSMHLLANLLPNDPCIESLRSLRTALQFAMLDAPNNIVLITGPTPGIGKSFISANFAAVLAAGGKRVLLLDADLRKGHIHESFGLPRGHGLSELISGTQTLAQVTHPNVSQGLDFIATGPLPPNPAELLMSPATVQLLQAVGANYDMVVIDTPPVLAVSDTQVMASLAGSVFMVARAEISTLAELQESAKRLGRSGVTVRGVIFNDLNLSKRRYGYGYGYGYKYSRYRYAQYDYGQTKTALK
ncbi:MAG: polysaccharide biosynthesis tyrosine autokinase [Betaproteobacteria bacterium]|nr:polysaccharide biosynthesis tyrosine autokinase [Betaproteobacteria bacterium]NCP82849.1 polysaccharide biosynthesis tyrosine autokinase [Rhodoferax sp.]NCS61124.1 polysaccharide biosynthesis tyrosine autokinase [Rhodoferax sp.]PIZ23980.1 MAG: tyrosine protein kinase [Comamonadaceae bacterium CG_4_10_14_0_8_um_filter_57_29]PJC17856.1 MAG: tyrosine protein kinase [Comamonadaceae bacterium CG_4_9_14_0_8_um_filter_57_21]